MRRLFPALALMMGFFASAEPVPSAGDQILGEWRGTSRCTNLTLLPACKDEQVRYTFTRNAGANSYHQVADKMVAGSYETMGEMDFDYSEADGTWSHEFSARTCKKCRWWYRLKSGDLLGGATDDSGAALREVLAKRYTP